MKPALVYKGAVQAGVSQPSRELYVLSIATLDQVSFPLVFSSRWFTCLVVADAVSLADDQLGGFTESLIKNGCVWACSWGSESAAVELSCDLSFIDLGSPIPFVVTTAHHNSLDDAIWFLLNCAVPAEDEIYESCSAVLAICVGSDVSAAKIAAAFTNPIEFCEEVVREGK